MRKHHETPGSRNGSRIGSFLGLFLALTFLSLGGLWAEEKTPDRIWPDKVKVGGEFRTRLEARLNDDFDSAQSDHDLFVLLRTRVYLDLNPTPYIQIFGMFQDAETLGQESVFIKTPDKRSFYQGFLYFKNPDPELSIFLKLGRQELIYGDQRLIGAFNWGNLGRSFDAGVLRFENSHFWLDLFGARHKLPNGKEAQLATGYAHWKDFPKGVLEPYVIFLHGNQLGLNNQELSLVTLGTRIKAKFLKNFDYGFEGAFQIGKNAGNLDRAFALHTEMGYTFPVVAKPRLAWEYNFASGDGNPGSGTVTTFNNLFPTNHGLYGYMDYFSWKNLHDFALRFSAKPYDFMKATLDYHVFLLPEPADGVFAANGALFRPGVPGASHFAGQEIDFLLVFTPWKHLKALVGYSVFFPGSFFSDTGSSDVAQFFYTQFALSY